MAELREENLRVFDRQSSKGNQLKWKKEDIWYKADYAGYEGLAEYVVAALLGKSSLDKDEYVRYDLEQMRYKRQIYKGCKSNDFLPEGYHIVTLERLFQATYGESLTQSIYAIAEVKDRIHFLVDQVERITGLARFGEYMSKMLTIDAFFLNEDRHMHNIAVLRNDSGEYRYCPFFDQGAALLSDTTMDYPLAGDVEEMIGEVTAKTVCQDFDEALDAVEELYGKHMQFYFKRKEIEEIMQSVSIYADGEKERIGDILIQQCRKYQYLF